MNAILFSITYSTYPYGLKRQTLQSYNLPHIGRLQFVQPMSQSNYFGISLQPKHDHVQLHCRQPHLNHKIAKTNNKMTKYNQLMTYKNVVKNSHMIFIAFSIHTHNDHIFLSQNIQVTTTE